MEKGDWFVQSHTTGEISVGCVTSENKKTRKLYTLVFVLKNKYRPGGLPGEIRLKDREYPWLTPVAKEAAHNLIALYKE